MKHVLAISLIVSIIAGIGIGCHKNGEGKNPGSIKEKLYIFNWSYYMPEELRANFEKEFNVQVVYDEYPSNEEMFAKIKAGGTGYDIVYPSEDYVSIMIKEKMLDTIDKSKVPNFSLIDSAIVTKCNQFDPGCRFSVPYMMGSSGIAVNKKYVKNYEKSWRIFERTDLKNRMTLLDDMREVLGAALITLGYSVNTINPDELKQARQLVLKWRNNIQKFDAESFAKSFAAGEFWVVHCYAENVYREYDSTKRDEIDFFIPQEGTPMYIDNMCILKDARHKDLAHAWINYIHRPENYAKICDYLLLPSLNVPARALTREKPNYTPAALEKCELKKDLAENLPLYDKMWQEIRIGN